MHMGNGGFKNQHSLRFEKFFRSR